MTSFSYFSKNGEILPIEQATVPLSLIEFTYGYGVYETLKVRQGILYFVDQHVERLFRSAQIIELEHSFTKEQIKQYILDLVKKLNTDACNIKMLLIGGKEPQLFIEALAPLFPDRKLYSRGAKTITVYYERPFPNAKTLNMLPSYLAYKKAKEASCYDALLLTEEGNILEGTRTNFFVINDKEIITPPVKEVLEGVTRMTVIKTAVQSGYTVKEANISLKNISSYEGAFVTSTSSKIVPIKQIDDFVFLEIPEKLKELIKAYDTFLNNSKGIF